VGEVNFLTIHTKPHLTVMCCLPANEEAVDRGHLLSLLASEGVSLQILASMMTHDPRAPSWIGSRQVRWLLRTLPSVGAAHCGVARRMAGRPVPATADAPGKGGQWILFTTEIVWVFAPNAWL